MHKYIHKHIHTYEIVWQKVTLNKRGDEEEEDEEDDEDDEEEENMAKITEK